MLSDTSPEQPGQIDTTIKTQEQTSLGSSELLDLFNNPTWRDNFIRVQTQPFQDAIDLLNREVSQRAKAKANGVIIEMAAEEMGTSVEEAKKGKELGQKIVEIKKRGEQIKQIETKFMQEESANPEYIEQRKTLTEILENGKQEQGKRLEELQEEAMKRQEDPQLLEALGVWGRSPDSTGSLGSGDGFNAGIIHYFEYRADKDKNGRYKYDSEPISIDGFIKYSGKINDLIKNPNPETNQNIKTATMIKDEKDQVRLLLLTTDGMQIVGFRREGEESIKAITILPGQSEKEHTRRVKDELKQPEESSGSKKRLNNLQGARQEIPLSSTITNS